MYRPLVWVGVAYMAGGIWAALGQSVFTGLMIVILLLMITGRYRRQVLKRWSFYMLPVFFVSSFAGFSREMLYPCEEMVSGGDTKVSFYGKVSLYEEKENSLAVIMTLAEISFGEYGTETAYEEVDAEAKEEKMGVILYFDKEEKCPDKGDMIRGTGKLEKMESATNPGQFDMGKYYHARGIDYILWPDEMVIESRFSSYEKLLQKFRDGLISVYHRYLTQRDAAVICAILLGDRTLLDEDTQALYQKVGIVHILAISGLHISMIGMGIFCFFRRLGTGLHFSSCAAAFIVLSYGVMTGFGPSTERAVTMFLIKMGAVYMGRSYDMLSALSLAALIIFFRQPLMITQSGVQFSFAAVLSIGVLWPAMKQVLSEGENGGNQQKKNSSLKIRILNHVGPSAAVTVGTLPLAAFYYGEIPLVSVFLNLIVLPMMEWLVPTGLVLGLAGFFWGPAARFLAGSVHIMLALNYDLCKLASEIPFAVWRTGVPPSGLVAAYYIALVVFIALAASMNSPRLVRFSGSCRKWLVVCLIAGGLILVPFRRMSPMIAFLDVGQGDCIFIRTPSAVTWLVDGGSSDVRNVGKYRIEPFLNYYGEEGVDYACVTHGDEDHMSGIRELLAENKVGHLVLTGAAKKDPSCMELAALASEKDIETIYIASGDCWKSGEWIFECLSPMIEKTEADKNDSSMVLKLQAGKTDFLLTGDISEKAEVRLDAEKLAGTDVLKVAHHGSGSSSSREFLETTGAKMAVISCGKNNRYGHPAEETLERLKAAGMDIVMTMEKGAVLMRYDNRGFHIQFYMD